MNNGPAGPFFFGGPPGDRRWQRPSEPSGGLAAGVTRHAPARQIAPRLALERAEAAPVSLHAQGPGRHGPASTERCRAPGTASPKDARPASTRGAAGQRSPGPVAPRGRAAVRSPRPTTSRPRWPARAPPPPPTPGCAVATSSMRTLPRRCAVGRGLRALLDHGSRVCVWMAALAHDLAVVAHAREQMKGVTPKPVSTHSAQGPRDRDVGQVGGW